MRIESGPTRERTIRTTLAFLMFTVGAVLFVYDGWIRYPRQNLDEYLSQLPPEQRDQARAGRHLATVTMDSQARAREAIAVIGTDAKRAALEKLYGGPPSHENSDAWLYYGPACIMTVELSGGRPTGQVTAHGPKHSENDLLIQRSIGVGLAMVAVILVWQVIRVRRTRLILDDAGLSCRGHRPIAWDEMQRLDSHRFEAKGWVDLYYDRNGIERFIRLDEYHLAAFDEVVGAICKHRGFESPLRKKALEDDT
ncbi:MAG: hypothetical protein ACE5F9_12110 [Phycisphaerae bacterium]